MQKFIPSFHSGKLVVSSGSTHQMLDCDHEEADTRMVVHVMDAIQRGARTVQIRTVDTDVLVVLIGKFHELCTEENLPLDVWVAFGMGKHFTFHRINSICTRLGVLRSKALPGFHAFTGCDTTSFFHGRGKKTAWQTWNAFGEAGEAFTSLSQHPFSAWTVESAEFKVLERFTVLMYDSQSVVSHVNEVRKILFCQRNREIEHLPPTQVRIFEYFI